MSSEQILYSVKEKVAYISFNRAPANAYSLHFYEQFHTYVAQANQDNEVGAVVINSTSERFFCAGADIKEFQRNSTSENKKMVMRARKTLAAIEASSKIFIAQIAGHCLGGGLEIAMACDIRFASTGSYQFGLPEVKLGLMPGNGGTQRLLKLVGYSKAIEILSLGNTFGAEVAYRWGLLNRLSDVENLHTQTFEFAASVANGPLLAIAATKKALSRGAELPLTEGLQLEKELCDSLYDTHDGKEGFLAFVEKRNPVFTGN